MKKVGKKLSYLTKVFLVLSLTFSNLIGLSTVFAYEGEITITPTINEDKIVLGYEGELEDDFQVRVDISENYTYIDESEETELTASYEITGADLAQDGGYSITSQMIPNVVFDGTYTGTVKVYNAVEETLMAEESVTKDFTFESGMQISLLDVNDKPLEPNSDGKYVIDTNNPQVKAVGVLLPGGLAPSDTFVYDDTEYTAANMLNSSLTKDIDFAGLLYGDYKMPITFTLTKNEEEVSYSEDFNFVYGTYQMNTDYLNDVANDLGLDSNYVFVGEEADGEVYVYLTSNSSLLDLYSIVSEAIGGSEDIELTLSNSSSEDVAADYEPVDELDSLEAYLSEFSIDDSTIVTISCKGLIITYKAVIVGDVNGDNAVNTDDLMAIIDQVVGNASETDSADVYGDDGVNIKDVIYLDQVIKNNDFNQSVYNGSASLSASLTVSSDDITSGDEFEVTYALTSYSAGISGVSGVINYDSEKLSLISATFNKNLMGSEKDGKFLYVVNGDALRGNPVILTLKFIASAAGSSDVTINDIEYFYNSYYYGNNNDLAATVIVNESEDNSLESLTVGGQEITLEDGVYEYSIDVANDVTSVDVEAITKNVAAKIISTIIPKELAEGENTITITVKAENGDEAVYTITVNRAAKPEEKEETVSAVSYSNSSSDSGNTKVDEKPTEVVPDTGEPEPEPATEEKTNIARIIIIILILLVIAGLIYLIFRDEEDEESKKANKDIDKLKKEDSNFRDNKTQDKGNNKKGR